MDLFLNGSPTRREDLTFDEASLGSVRGALSFEIILQRSELISLLGDAYAECVRELRRDDVLTGEFMPPFPGATDYPQFDDFISAHPENFEEFFQAYLCADFLRALFVECSPASPYLMRTIDGLRGCTTITVHGTASKWSPT